jgi:acyl-CoA thioester hydrolase
MSMSAERRAEKANPMGEIFATRLRVYYQDTDAGGIVYHANYLNFAERGRTEALRAMGIPHAQMVRQFNAMFVVRRVVIDYQRPARIDEEIRVETQVVRVGGASATLRQQILRDTDSLVVLELGLACATLDGKDTRMPEPWRQRLVAAGLAAAGPAAPGVRLERI